jgi:hypothetical protein
MKTLVSFQALTAALAASLGLQACGGETSKLKDGPPGTGGRDSATGGDTATSETGGLANTGGAVSLGNPGSAGTDRGGGGGDGGGGGSGGGLAIQGGFSGMSTPGPAPCDSLSPDVNYQGEPTGLESCRNQTKHRISNAECAVYVPRAHWTCHGDFKTFCTTDADCTEKPLGGCFVQGQGRDVCDCEYGCRTDEDCEDGGICACAGDVGKCLPATCRTDADCGEGLQCRSYQHPDSENCDDVRYECQTAEDTCDSSYEDCVGMGKRCMSDATGVHHCREHYCYNVGRPFWVKGRLRAAEPARRIDWGSEAFPSFASELSAGDRTALASYFTRAALMEHASIAAFARFALELLHLGAPLELVSGAQRAMGEELEHARLCFALASRYAGKDVGPGPLSVAGCLDQLSLEAAVRSAVREGCVGETVAAVQAAEALEHARDEEVRAVLARIQRDEFDHARLAFLFVRWALEVDPTLADPVLEELRACAPPSSWTEDPMAAEQRRAEHGLLPDAHLAAIASRVHAEMVSTLLSDLVLQACKRAA